MATSTPSSDRSAEVLRLMKEGDDAFNAQDFDAMKAAHHPDMIAHVTGNAEPIRGRDAHAVAMAGMFRMFPDVHVHNDPYPVQFADGDWMTVITNVTGTFSGELVLPDGNVIPGTGKPFDLTFSTTARWEGELLVESGPLGTPRSWLSRSDSPRTLVGDDPLPGRSAANPSTSHSRHLPASAPAIVGTSMPWIWS